MLEMSDAIEPIQPAATVVLVRDGAEGLEVLLVQRNKAVQHMGGMWVFPGGKIDHDDYPDDRDPYTAALNAAIRETREETGVTVEPDQLVYQSHWTTPEGAKRRFSTWFFLTILRDGQEVVVDGGEIANHRWVRPEVAFVELSDQSHPFRLMPPTYISLLDIADCADCLEASQRVGSREAFVYAPRMVLVDDGICFLYDGDAGYETEEVDIDGPRHRTYMIDGQLEYIREC